MNHTAILMQNISRRFGQVEAIKDVSLEVPSGIVFGFLGPNGAGKTTTIRLLLGLLQADAGRAEVLGYDTGRQSAEIRQRCGALLEHTGLYERLSAEDNLDFYGRVWHIPQAKRQQRIRELLESLGLWERRREQVGKWSRGMKQKVAVARALLHEPELLFLDEPSAGLDPIAAAALREDLLNLVQQHGVTVFLTTHNLPEAEKLCQRVALIRAGEVLLQGAPDELHRHMGSNQLEISGSGFSEAVLTSLRSWPGVLEVHTNGGSLRLDLQPGTDTAPLVQTLAAGGVQIEEVRKGKANLEEIFLDLMKEENASE